MDGEAHVDVQLAKRLQTAGDSKNIPNKRSRSIQQLLEAAEKLRKQKIEKNALAAEKARISKLKDLVQKEPLLWHEVFSV